MVSPTIVNLLEWQKNWINDEARYKLVVASAQSGKSFGTSLEFTMDAIGGKAPLGIFLSASDRQSMELMEKVKLHVKAMGAASEYDAEFWKGTSIMQHTARFGNGCRLIALPANPDTARGYSGNLFFDEFAMHRDSKAIWAAGMTRATRGYKVRVASTLKGLKNKFGELTKMLGLADGVAPTPNPLVRNGWSGHWVDIFMAAKQGAPVNPEQIRQSLDDEDIWLQEYCNMPMEDGSDFIALALILACENSEASLDWAGNATPGLCAGFDVARKRDGSILVIGEPVGPLAIVRGVKVLSRLSFAEQFKVCAEVAEVVEASGGRFAVDATGIGMQIAEQLSEKFPCVEAVNFATSVETGQLDSENKPVKVLVKERMAGILKRRVEERMIWLPESVQLRREFQAVKRYVGPTGAVRLDSERTDKAHADWFWATALMCAAMEGQARRQPMKTHSAIGGQTVLGSFMGRVF